MTIIAKEEIKLGIVAFLDQSMIQKNDLVEHTVFQKDPRPGPFLCIKIEGEFSWWTALTTRPRTTSGHSRLPIKKRHRTGSHPQWLNAEQYLNDGASIYYGPTDEFCKAAYRETTTPTTRSFVSIEATESVLSEIQKQSGRREKELSRAP